MLLILRFPICLIYLTIVYTKLQKHVSNLSRQELCTSKFSAHWFYLWLFVMLCNISQKHGKFVIKFSVLMYWETFLDKCCQFLTACTKTCTYGKCMDLPSKFIDFMLGIFWKNFKQTFLLHNTHKGTHRFHSFICTRSVHYVLVCVMYHKKLIYKLRIFKRPSRL